MSATGIAARPAARPLGGRLATAGIVVVTAVVIAIVAFVIDSPTASGVTKVNLTDTSAAPPQAGQVPPDFTATTIDGKTVSLSALKGQPVWLTFGASWCGDCRAEAPDLEATYTKLQSKGLVVVAVSIQEDATAVQEYAKRIGFTFT
ncbi:MAG TPA: TlpA disulfide reductase family protein, partial [Candidatus Dormibacteraeota bacterium]|nr:TlpA disulfide reductase family protein [Candidatus Dormibacteraeota bacterium]